MEKSKLSSFSRRKSSAFNGFEGKDLMRDTQNWKAAEKSKTNQTRKPLDQASVLLAIWGK